MKTCTKCGETKPFAEYYKSRLGKHGLASQCKSCKDKQSRAHRETNAAHYAEGAKKRAAAHRKEHPEYMREYRRINREKLLAQGLARYRTHLAPLQKERYRASVETLADSYVRTLIQQGSSLPSTAIPFELIELKRAELKLKRLIKSKENHE